VGIHGRGGTVLFPGPEALPRERDHEWEARARGDAESPHPDALDHAARALLWNLGELYSTCDLLLVEGLKASALPKILVNRGDNPRGELSASSLSHVVCEVRGASLPTHWDEAIARVTDALHALIQSPARQRGRQVLGAVLAGGASSRMGEDKAALPLRGMAPGGMTGTWGERAFFLLAERCANAWVVGRIVRPGGPEIPSLRRPVLSHLDLRAGAGLLGGMETALTLAGGEAILTLPCDTPELPGSCLDRLLESRESGTLAAAFRNSEGRPEPAVVLLEPGALVELRRYLDAGGRKAGDFLLSIATRWLTLSVREARSFADLNTAEERAGYESRGRVDD
jgi:molybdenum cofactor guanylyltransferase